MATLPRKPVAERLQINFKQAVAILSREEAFMATVAAMNSLLIQKGVYTSEEFDTLFCSWAQAQREKKERQR
jgi:hypothetical protein